MPESYRYPNLEFYNDSTPVWELSFNLFPDSTLDYVHMFGLWNEKNATMRIYSYIEELPNPNATYCFYYVETSTPCFVEQDTRAFMPSTKTLQNSGHWWTDVFPDVIVLPSLKTTMVMPIQRSTDDHINSGWVCFDMNFSSGKFSLPENGTISFSLYGKEDISFEGTQSLAIALHCDSCGASGQIVTPGNKHKKTAGLWSTTGALFSGFASTISQTVSSKDVGQAAAAVGVLGGAGAICSAVGGYKSAYAETDTTKSSINMDFNLNFHGTATGDFNGQLTSVLGTTAGEVTLSYRKFFEEILNHPRSNQAPSRLNNNNSIDSISLGIWNLQNQPVIYVCGDARLEDGSLISFLDPSSIELTINENSQLFAIDEVDSIQLTAYDFSFVNGSYDFSTQPYYSFYGIHRDAITPARALLKSGLTDADFMLSDSASYQTFTKDNISYTGVVLEDYENNVGLQPYTVACSPRIKTTEATPVLDYVGVAVVMDVVYKNGEKRYFADRFLPEIRTFRLAEASALRDSLQSISPRTAIAGVTEEYLLFDAQKAKALRLLDSLEVAATGTYPIVYIDSVPYAYKTQYHNLICNSDYCNVYYDYGYGIRVRAYDPQTGTPGIVIRRPVNVDSLYHGSPPYTTCYQGIWPAYDAVIDLSTYLQGVNDWDNINDRLTQLGMVGSLNDNFQIYDSYYRRYFWYNIQEHSLGDLNHSTTCPETHAYIQIFYEDANGNLTLQVAVEE